MLYKVPYANSAELIGALADAIVSDVIVSAALAPEIPTAKKLLKMVVISKVRVVIVISFKNVC